MRNHTVFATLGVATLALAGSCVDQGDVDRSANRELTGLAEDISMGRVARIKAIQIPLDGWYRFAISPDTLDRTGKQIFTIDKLDGETNSELAALIRSGSPKHGNDITDVRRALIFYRADDRRLGALYFERNSRRGAVNRAPVVFRDDFFQQVKGILHLPAEF